MKRLPIALAGAALLTTGAVVLVGPAGAQQNTPYANCDDAYKDGRANIPSGDATYGKHLDADGDGKGCDNPPPGFVAKTTTTAAPGTTAPKATTTTAPGATTTTTAPGATTTTTTPAVRATPRFTG